MKLLGSIHEVKTISLRSADGKLVTIAVEAQTADRIASIPALAADDSFVMAAAVQTLSNKTFPLGAGNSFLGINDTVAGYLAVSESVQGFMDGVRAMTGYGGQKGAAWTALTAAEITYLSGTGSSIQGQFTANTQEHVTINERISALEGGQGGGTVSTLTIQNTAAPAFADTSSTAWVFAHNTAAGDVTFTCRAAPTANTTYQVRQDGTGTLTIAGNGVLIDGANTKTLSTGEWCWIRLINGVYETIDENAVCNTDEIFQSTMTITAAGSDFTDVAWLWVKFAPTEPITYDLRTVPLAGLTYHLSNKSSHNVTVQAAGGYLIDGQVSLVLAADDWAILHFTGTEYYIAARNGSTGGGGGFASGTVEMTTASLSDTREEALVFIEKTYAGEATFTLKATPVADDMRQIKNTGAGTLHVVYGAQTIIDLEPGDWAWLRFRDAAWYIADRSPLPLTSLEVSFVAGEALEAGDAVVLRGDTKVYKATSVDAESEFLGDIAEVAHVHAKKLTKYSWIECFLNDDDALMVRIKSVGATITTLAQATVPSFHNFTGTKSGLIQLADGEYLYWISDTDPSTHFCRISVVGDAIYTKMFTILTEFIGVDKISTRTYYAVAKNGTLYQIDDLANSSQLESTTSTFNAPVENCIVAFQGCALVVLTIAANTQRVLWYYNIGTGTTQREVIIGNQSNRAGSYVHRVGDTAGVIVASTKSDGTLEFCSYEFVSNTSGGLETGPIKTEALARGAIGYVDSHLLEYNGTVSTFEYRVGFFASSTNGETTTLTLDEYTYDADAHSFNPLNETHRIKGYSGLPIMGFLGTPAVPIAGQFSQDGMCTVYMAAQSGTYQYTFDVPQGLLDPMPMLPLVSLEYPFLGFTNADAAQNASVPVKLGPIITGLSSLAVGAIYNLGPDGTVTTKFLAPEMKVGLAVSTTTMITKVYEG